MDATVVEVDRLDLKDDRELLSPPWLAGPLYRCATAVTVWGFLPHALLDVEVDGAVVVAGHAAGFPEPQGERVPVPALAEHQQVRVRQHADGLTSDWSPVLEVRDHTVDFPAGPPRPVVNPAPVWTCGARTGVGNLLGGADVWITADGAEVGRVDGCSQQQGVDVNPFYADGQKVRAHTELCGDPASPSVELTVTAGPNPLPAPAFDPVHDGAEQVRVTGIANGARVTVTHGTTSLGTFRCWGGALLVGVGSVGDGDLLSATQQLCPGDPASPEGTTTVQPCSALGAPAVGPVQAGDTAVTITSSAPGALIRVYRNLVQVGSGTAPVVPLSQTLVAGDVVHVTQSLTTCPARVALQLTVACVDPPVAGDPAALDLFPVGRTEYADGPVRGSIHYPAQDDGVDQPFHARLAETGPVPVVVMAHGNHSPADPSYLGYDYFQTSLAKAGMVAVSVDCNALNGPGGGVQNIEDRADLIIDTIRHLQTLAATPGSVLEGRLDFSRVGLMGHSRGGDAVVMVPAVMGAIGVTVRAVLALAPTNFRYWFGMPTIAPVGYAFSTVLPASDGDVVDNNGAQFYDVSEPGPFSSQVYVHSTNHNFFNRRWAADDGVTPVFSRGTHERVLDVYGSALFRGVLLGDGSAAYLLGTVTPAGVPVHAVDLAYRVEKADTVDHHDDGNGIGTNSFGLPTSATGGAVADEFPFDQVPGAFNGSFFGLTVGMVLRSRERGGGDFRSEIGTADLTSSEVWVRVAEVVDGGVAKDGVTFDLGLEDARGTVAWIGSASVGGVPRPFERPGQSKTMLSTLRFRPLCIGRRSRLDLGRVVAVHLRTTTDDDRPVAFDDLQLVPV
ncbi:alpha/beta hydrolase family protein [Cellulomonas sp. 179-A 9B4 NHS]|uniref:S9 family peptidase n=1 Tax=Cellulomonas sp. 179-A 9B4 NHS TaxID=3142379 RepID=UPI00399FB8BE